MTADVPYPEMGWTWEAFRTIANQLTVVQADETLQWGFVEPFPRPYLFIAGQLDAPLINTNSTPPTPRFTDTDVVAAVRWYTNLYGDDGAAPYLGPANGEIGTSPPSNSGVTLIETGRAAMWAERSVFWDYYRNRIQNMGVVPYPVSADHQATTPVFVDGLFMSEGAARPEAAWRWMAFLSHQQPPSNLLGTPPLPARASVAATTGFWETIDLELATALGDALDRSLPWHYRAAGYQALEESIHHVLAENAPIEVVLAEGQLRAEQEIVATSHAAVESVTIDDASDQLETNTITIRFSGGHTAEVVYEPLIEAFESENNSVNVELVSRFDLGESSDFTSFATNTDCFKWGLPPDAPEQQAVLLNLDPFLQEEPMLSPEDFYSVALAHFTRQGQLWGLPADLDIVGIHYNKDLFDAADLAYPTLNWTKEDFLETAVTLTNTDTDTQQYGFLAPVFEGPFLLFMLEALGGEIFNERVDPPTLALTHPATIEAMRWYASLDIEHDVKPLLLVDPAEVDGFGFGSQINNIFTEWHGLINGGHAAMWPAFGPGLDEDSETHVGLAPLPGDAINSFIYATAYFISRNADMPHSRACWQWIKFLSETAVAVRGFPARRSVAESPAYRQMVGAEQAALYLASVNHDAASGISGYFSGSSRWINRSADWLHRALGQIVIEGVPVEEAMATAQTRFDAYRHCIIERAAFIDNLKQQECILEVDPALAGRFGREQAN